MWALGVLFYKMLTKVYPFVGKNNKMLLRDIVQSEVSFQPSMKIRHISILKKVLHKNPQKRPSVEDLVNFFDKCVEF